MAGILEAKWNILDSRCHKCGSAVFGSWSSTHRHRCCEKYHQICSEMVLSGDGSLLECLMDRCSCLSPTRIDQVNEPSRNIDVITTYLEWKWKLETRLLLLAYDDRVDRSWMTPTDRIVYAYIKDGTTILEIVE